MNTLIKLFITATTLAVSLSFSVISLAEENEQHKHYKAAMMGESHQAYTDKTAEKDTSENTDQDTEKAHNAQSHEHYKATMPGESHKAHTEHEAIDEAIDAANEKKTHKHYKSTMKGEKHNQ